MKCFYHPEVDAVATCQECGKGLCKDCICQCNGEILCDDCRQKMKNESTAEFKKSYFKVIRMTIIYSIVGILLAFVLGAATGSAWWLLTFFIPFGWYSGNESEASKTRKLIMELNNPVAALLGKIIGFLIKFCISIVLGVPRFIKLVFIDFPSLYKMNKELKNNKL